MSSSSTLLTPIRWWLVALAAFALLTLITLGVRSWLAARDAITQLNAIIASQKQILERATAQEQERDTATAKAVASIKRATAAVKTPAEAAEAIPEVLPSLPIPLEVNLPPKDAADPSPSATATVPQVDLQPIYSYIQDCHICESQLSAAQADLADERAKEAALTTERNVAIKAAHGGSFWSHVKGSAKWLLLGAAAGAIIGEAIHQTAH